MNDASNGTSLAKFIDTYCGPTDRFRVVPRHTPLPEPALDFKVRLSAVQAPSRPRMAALATRTSLPAQPAEAPAVGVADLQQLADDVKAAAARLNEAAARASAAGLEVRVRRLKDADGRPRRNKLVAAVVKRF